MSTRSAGCVGHVPGGLARLEPTRLAVMQTVPLRGLLQHACPDADLCAIALGRGYKPGWVWHIWRERAGRVKGAA